jgi:predicted nucleotidyltransferase component of viral defense system
MSRLGQAKKVMDSLKKLEKKSEHNSLNELRLVVALERAIARLERHPRLASHLIFKGGFVLLKTVATTRFTRDVDALAIGVSRTSIVGMIEHALKIDLDDGLWFGDIEVDDLKDQGPYGGYRFNCAFQIGDPPKEKTKVKKLSRVHIDVGFGDAVKKMTAKQPMQSILVDSKPVSWSVYPLEYIFAEKLEALFSRGSANSRAKDVYDMPLIFPKCDRLILLEAVKKTFQGRETPLPKSFMDSAIAFDLSVLRGAWGSVDLSDSTVTFDDSWKALLLCLKKMDTV